jgi:hypothetical protein
MKSSEEESHLSPASQGREGWRITRVGQGGNITGVRKKEN